MTLWFFLALMTGAAVFAVVWPLSRTRKPALGAGVSDLDIYRDQMEEIERDRAAGLIGPSEADAARLELSRRLLAAAQSRDSVKEFGASPSRRRLASLIAIVLIPLGAGGLYLRIGSPELPGQPLAARLVSSPETRSIEALVAQVEAHLERNPNDARGWEVLAPVYMRLGRFGDAVKARRTVVRLDKPTAAREADLGEALTAEANGIVTADAKSAFERALALDAADFKARFFTGLAAEQDGERARAAAIWRRLIDEAPADAGWTDFVREALARVTDQQPGLVTKEPKAGDVEAAADLSAEQRGQLVRGMVERLAERLKRDGTDVDAWVRLVRSYVVLGDRDMARNALVDARRALEGDAEKTKRLDELLKSAGVRDQE